MGDKGGHLLLDRDGLLERLLEGLLLYCGGGGLHACHAILKPQTMHCHVHVAIHFPTARLDIQSLAVEGSVHGMATR